MGGCAARASVTRVVLTALFLAAVVAPGYGQVTTPSRAVAPFQVVPNDMAFALPHLRLNVRALADVRAWYAARLRGATFAAEPFVVFRSRHTFDELAADDFQAWWPLLLAEFAGDGYAWNDSSSIKLLLLAQGAGGWAGGDSENGGLERRADAGTVNRGALGGAVLIGDSSAAGITSGACPIDAAEDGTVWWCHWNTYRGTIAHELGHTWGLPHPDALWVSPDSARGWDCPMDGNTVMQCHWGFPNDSLLDYEVEHLRSLPYFSDRGGPPVMLVDQQPVLIDGDARFRRLDVGSDESGAVAWIDGTTGEASSRFASWGYPWAVVAAAGSVTWSVDGFCGVFATDVGRSRGAGGRGTARVIVDGAVIASVDLPADRPQRIAARLCDAHQLALRVEGQGRLRVVWGNPRIDPE